ncbi:9680_t:CDS:2 [Diversispora eburnea]|uniref:9680_t:CDS:1 n=1 Tax=Diversispora eburnea TaxID=1213867 RepID=A0A9N8W201_9GLOM|nr:9680_t:CDS:2 [Diversispora eburnea]
MSFIDPDNTIFPTIRNFEQKLQNDLNIQKVNTLLKYLFVCTNKNFPIEKKEFELEYSITDEKWKKEPELNDIRNNLSQISEHCKEFKEKQIFEKSVELFQDIINLCKEFKKDNTDEDNDYNQVIKIIKNWEEDYKQNINDIIQKHQTNEDWEVKLRMTKKKFPEELLKVIKEITEILPETIQVLYTMTRDLKTIAKHLKALNEIFIKFGDKRGPISIKKIYLEDIKSRLCNLNELASDYFDFVIVAQQQEKTQDRKQQ